MSRAVTAYDEARELIPSSSKRALKKAVRKAGGAFRLSAKQKFGAAAALSVGAFGGYSFIAYDFYNNGFLNTQDILASEHVKIQTGHYQSFLDSSAEILDVMESGTLFKIVPEDHPYGVIRNLTTGGKFFDGFARREDEDGKDFVYISQGWFGAGENPDLTGNYLRNELKLSEAQARAFQVINNAFYYAADSINPFWATDGSQGETLASDARPGEYDDQAIMRQAYADINSAKFLAAIMPKEGRNARQQEEYYLNLMASVRARYYFDSPENRFATAYALTQAIENRQFDVTKMNREDLVRTNVAVLDCLKATYAYESYQAYKGGDANAEPFINSQGAAGIFRLSAGANQAGEKGTLCDLTDRRIPEAHKDLLRLYQIGDSTLLERSGKAAALDPDEKPENMVSNRKKEIWEHIPGLGR